MPALSAAAAAPPAARHPLVERVLQNDASEAIRLTAARGNLPIPAHDLVFLQVHLLKDSFPSVAQAATRSLGAVPIETIVALLHDPACDPVLVDYFARSGRLSGELLGIAIAHPAIPDATLESLAASESPETLNLLVTNEQRVIDNAALFQVLSANSHLTPDNRRRLAELQRDFIGKAPVIIERTKPPVGKPPAIHEIPAPEPPVEITTGLPAAGTDALDESGAPDEATAEETALSGEPGPPIETTPDEEDLRSSPAFQRILRLGVPERVQLAAKGSTEERAILVRDTTKMVAMQVMKNPKLSNGEVAGFAAMRNVHEDILRQIARKRDWTKDYSVIHALAKNPKTPPGIAIPYLSRLGVRDLKIMARDKNISEVLRRSARNLFLARTQKGGKKH